MVVYEARQKDKWLRGSPATRCIPAAPLRLRGANNAVRVDRRGARSVRAWVVSFIIRGARPRVPAAYLLPGNLSHPASLVRGVFSRIQSLCVCVVYK